MKRTCITELDEKQLDELLAYTPSFTSQNMENIEKLFLQKITSKRRSMTIRRGLLIAAVVAIISVVSIAALAATGIINVDIRGFYDSIFSNPESSPYIANEDLITITGSGSDLVIKPIAGFIDEPRVYIQLELTTQTDKQFPETLFFYNNGFWISEGDTEITVIDEHSAIVSFKTSMGFASRDPQSGELHFSFDAISSAVGLSYDNGYEESLSNVGTPSSDSNDFTCYGQWVISLSQDSIVVPRTVECSFEGRDAEMTIAATSIGIRVFGSQDAPYTIDSSGSVSYQYDAEGTIKITLADGSVIEKSRIESSADVGGDWGMASYSCTTSFINPADVISVELFGVVLMG